MEFNVSDEVCHKGMAKIKKKEQEDAIREQKRQEQERRDNGEIRSWGFDANFEMGI